MGWGSGYPYGIAAEAIDLKARIFAVVDAFEAMTSDRVFRHAISFDEAVEELDRCAGGHFDPNVVAAFQRVPLAQWARIREASLLNRNTDGNI